MLEEQDITDAYSAIFGREFPLMNRFYESDILAWAFWLEQSGLFDHGYFMHVLVTGASSFLGRHIAMHLVGAGHQVTGTYRNDHPCLAPLRAAQVALAPLDLADAESYGVLPSSIDAVVHVAGVSITPGISLDGHARL
jgi:hypothetical protein